MNKNVLLFQIFFLLVCNCVSAQIPAWQWLDNVAGVVSPKDMTTDSQGNVYVTGFFESSTVTFGDIVLNNPASFKSIFLVKYNTDGDVLWAKVFGGTWTNEGWNVAVDNEDNVFINGFFRSATITFGNTVLTNNSLGADNSMFITKLNSNGDVLWAKSAQTGNIASRAQGLEIDNDGNAVMTGVFFGYISIGGVVYQGEWGSSGMFVVKYDPSGNILWSKGLRSSTGGEGMALDNEGNIYIAGSYISLAPNNIVIGTTTLSGSGLFLVKYSASGDVIWVKTFNGSMNQAIKDLVADSNGNILLTGNYAFTLITFDQVTLTSNGDRDVFLVKYDPNGNLIWAKSAGGEFADTGNKLALDSQDNIYLSGNFKSTGITFGSTILIPTSENYKSVFITKYSSSGANIWAFALNTTYGGDATTDYQALTVDANDNVYIGGVTSSNTALGNITVSNGGLFAGKLNSASLTIKDYENAPVTVYPNPVKDIVNLNIIHQDITSVRVYDVSGKCVITEHGNSVKFIDLCGLMPGLYVVEMTTENGRQIQKIMKQ